MPKLSHLKITKGQAMMCLLGFYRNDLVFMKELKELRQPYLEMIKEIAIDWWAFGVKCVGVLPHREFQELMITCLEGKEQSARLPYDLDDHLSRVQQKGNELGSYGDELTALAYRWKLRTPLAVPMLVLLDMVDILTESCIPERIDVPIESFDLLYPFQPVLPPLKIEVSSLAFVFYNRKEIISQVSKKLDDYEANLKERGMKERPSALNNHAKWWFEHYVQHKKFDDIAQMECHTPDGSLISYARNVATATRKFSKLIGISPETLK